MSAAKSWDGIESFYNVGIDITKGREGSRQQQRWKDSCQAAQVTVPLNQFLSSMSPDTCAHLNAIMEWRLCPGRLNARTVQTA